MSINIKNVAQNQPIPIFLDKVEKEPGPYCMSFLVDLVQLKESIQKIGIINPPILIRNDRKMFDIVSGYRRIHALYQLDCAEAFCIVLPESESSPIDCIHTALFENCLVRNFNDVEKSMILRRLRPFVQEEYLLRQYMPILKLSSQKSVLDLYLALESFELPLLESLVRGTLSLHSIQSMLDMNKNDRIILNEWINKLKLNINYQKYFIEYAVDISFKRQVSIADFLNDKTLKSIIKAEEINVPQKSKKVLNLLREMRYPRLTQAEKIFRNEVSRLDLPAGAKITAPPNFEGHEYTLEIRFEDGGILAKKISEISLALKSSHGGKNRFLENP